MQVSQPFCQKCIVYCMLPITKGHSPLTPVCVVIYQTGPISVSITPQLQGARRVNAKAGLRWETRLSGPVPVDSISYCLSLPLRLLCWSLCSIRCRPLLSGQFATTLPLETWLLSMPLLPLCRKLFLSFLVSPAHLLLSHNHSHTRYLAGFIWLTDWSKQRIYWDLWS